METEVKHYVYIYIEHSALGKPYLRHQDLAGEMKKGIGEAFREAGGIDLITTGGEGSLPEAGGPAERRIVSVWDSTEGYDRWLRDARAKAFVEFRDEYNRKNGITSLRTGPFVHTMKKVNE